MEILSNHLQNVFYLYWYSADTVWQRLDQIHEQLRWRLLLWWSWFLSGCITGSMDKHRYNNKIMNSKRKSWRCWLQLFTQSVYCFTPTCHSISWPHCWSLNSASTLWWRVPSPPPTKHPTPKTTQCSRRCEVNEPVLVTYIALNRITRMSATAPVIDFCVFL